MKVRIVRVGKPAFPAYRELTAVFEERLRTFYKVEAIELKAKKEFETDGQALLDAAIPDMKSRSRVCVIALDERGSTWSSKEFAGKLEQWTADPRFDTVCFVIGPPFGSPADFMSKADMSWCLSPCTMTSDMAWLLVWEQLYRASTIIRGIKYHHE